MVQVQVRSPRQRTENDIDALVKAAKAGNRKSAPGRSQRADHDVAQSTSAFVVALGDLQLGKMDGDGVEGTVARFIATTEAAVKRYKRVAKGSPVYLIHLGDCIEGMVSQGGANTWRTSLTTTEQVRLYRRLLLEQIKAFAAVAPIARRRRRPRQPRRSTPPAAHLRRLLGHRRRIGRQ